MGQIIKLMILATRFINIQMRVIEQPYKIFQIM